MFSYISCVLLLFPTEQAHSSNQPTYLGFISCCIFFPFGINGNETIILLVTDGSHIFRGGKKIPSGTAGNGVSTTCCIPKHCIRKTDPPRLLRTFLIFIYQTVAACVYQGAPGSSLGSIRFIYEVRGVGVGWGVLEKKNLLYLRTEENVFVCLGLVYERNIFFCLKQSNPSPSSFSRLHKYFNL